jgi:hypothetical protein
MPLPAAVPFSALLEEQDSERSRYGLAGALAHPYGFVADAFVKTVPRKQTFRISGKDFKDARCVSGVC